MASEIETKGDPAAVHSPGSVHARAAGASVVQVETLGKGGAVVLYLAAAVSVGALCVAMFSWWVADIAEREARVAQDKMQYYEILMVEKGVIEANEVHH